MKQKLPIAKVMRKIAENVADTIVSLLSTLMPKVHTLISDNGREFSQHTYIANKPKAKFYFAYTYFSWKSGLNKNTNCLIRQYFPKKHDFTAITEYQVERVMYKLNNRPRKYLGFKTPNEVFFGIKTTVALAT